MMKNVIWDDEVSCCGGHRNGKVDFGDGEVLYVNESGGIFAVRAIFGNDVNVASSRVKGGERVGLTEAEFEQILAA